MKVTRINRDLLRKIIHCLPLMPEGSVLKSFEISNPYDPIDLKTEDQDLIVYEYDDLKDYDEEHKKVK